MKLKSPSFVRVLSDSRNNQLLRAEGKHLEALLNRKFSEQFPNEKIVKLTDSRIDLSGIYLIDAVDADKYPKSQYVKLKKPFYTLVDRFGDTPSSMSWALHKKGDYARKRYFSTKAGVERFFESCMILDVETLQPYYNIAEITHVKKPNWPKYICARLPDKDREFNLGWLEFKTFTTVNSSSEHNLKVKYIRLKLDESGSSYSYDNEISIIKDIKGNVSTEFKSNINRILSLV